MKEIEKLSYEIKSYFENLELKFEKEDFFIGNYYGYQAFFSPIQKSRIWIVGINPGIGYWNETEVILKKSEPIDKKDHCYISPKNHLREERWYNFSSSIWYLFNDNLNDLKLLENSSASNIHYLSTENKTKLYSFINQFPQEEQEVYWRKVEEWNIKLYNIIQPEIILSIGESPISDFFGCKFDIKKDIRKNKGNEGKEHEYYKFENTHLIKVRRTPSSIMNRHALGEMIKKLL